MTLPLTASQHRLAALLLATLAGAAGAQSASTLGVPTPAARAAQAAAPGRWVAHAAPAPQPVQAAAPVAPALDAAGEGRRQYLRLNCYGCHGMAAAGGMGPMIIGKERGDVAEVLKRGEDGGMPSYRAWVTDTDITNITAYLQSIGTPNEPTFNDWWKRVPPK